jgi:hypothetical protein
MEQPLDTADILATLRQLNAAVTKPLWLFGGVAVDFLVGRWTRQHGDIDLNALSCYREELTRELGCIGYRTTDSGWLTEWFQEGSGKRLEIVFLDQKSAGAAELNIPHGARVGLPGRYPMVRGYLDGDRFATLEGVKFRVCSPAGEWLARMKTQDLVGGRGPSPKIEHDLRLLESLLSEDELGKLRILVGRSG